jgi:hypothetical protein
MNINFIYTFDVISSKSIYSSSKIGKYVIQVICHYMGQMFSFKIGNIAREYSGFKKLRLWLDLLCTLEFRIHDKQNPVFFLFKFLNFQAQSLFHCGVLSPLWYLHLEPWNL